MSETPSSVKTFHYEEQLPPLPVPPLDAILDKYLLSVQPLLSDHQLAETKELVENFRREQKSSPPASSPSPSSTLSLYDELVKRSKDRKNWLEDWWLHLAYLSYRESSLINSNTAMIIEPDLSQPPPLRQAARYVVRMLQFRELIANETLSPEFQGKAPLCMNQVRRIYGTNRTPGDPADTLHTEFHAKHIIVVCRNQFFPVTVLFGRNGRTEDIITQDEMELQLERIFATARYDASPAVGILTTDSRTEWAKNRAILAQNDLNKKTLEAIEKSLFAVCLDDVVSLNVSFTTALTLHGFGSQVATGNRWFDKAIQIVVAKNGQTGINMEHSIADGVAVARLNMFMHGNRLGYNDQEPLPKKPDMLAELPAPQALRWNLPHSVLQAIASVARTTDAFISSLDLAVNDFESYGKATIKKFKVSPDAWFQMALQLAFYRVHGELTAVYETAATRIFYHGRTETIRSLSNDSARFVRLMTPINDPKGVNVVEAAKALKAAIDAHVKYTKEAMEGKGIDRALLGLRVIAGSRGEQPPAMFSDLAYKKSTYFRLSTSQVPVPQRLSPAFGPGVPDGYGVCYNVREDNIMFTVTNFTNTSTDGPRLIRAVKQALEDMRGVVELALKGSKL